MLKKHLSSYQPQNQRCPSSAPCTDTHIHTYFSHSFWRTATAPHTQTGSRGHGNLNPGYVKIAANKIYGVGRSGGQTGQGKRNASREFISLCELYAVLRVSEIRLDNINWSQVWSWTVAALKGIQKWEHSSYKQLYIYNYKCFTVVLWATLISHSMI